jgi:hypothetical protein
MQQQEERQASGRRGNEALGNALQAAIEPVSADNEADVGAEQLVLVLF